MIVSALKIRFLFAVLLLPDIAIFNAQFVAELNLLRTFDCAYKKEILSEQRTIYGMMCLARSSIAIDSTEMAQAWCL
jgi:hypothetical protein